MAKNQTSKKRGSPSALDRLTVAKAATLATDGRLEVALAIASVTSLVTVDASTHPFMTSPDDLFDLTFDDTKVGLDADQMRIFKAALARLLPQIAADVAQVPENPAESIEKVAEFIRLSLLSARTSSASS